MLTKEPILLTESVTEAAPLTGTKWRAKIIAADTWGSSAYYPAEVLERDGSRVFTAGLHMYQNHMTESEKWERPEGSVENLVGTLATDAAFEENGAEGPGLYADVEFYPSYVERIAEIHKDVGLSVRASGLTEDGEMDGRYGPVLVAFLSASSVDVVTKAGAGGKLTSILESDRELAGRPITITEGSQSMAELTKEDFEAGIQSLIESLSATIKESLAGEKPAEEPKVEENKEEQGTQEEVVIDHAAVAEALRANDLPAPAAKGIVTRIQEGASLEDAVKAEVEIKEAYVASAAEHGVVHNLEEGGEPRGLARAVQKLSKK